MNEPVYPDHGEKIGWALIGASTMAKDVVNPILRQLPESHVCGIFSSSFERGQVFAKENNIPKAYRSLDEALLDHSVQAVYISTTNDLHASQAIAAASEGRHILCEKPLAINLKDAENMVRAARQAGIVFAALHHQPALPQYRLVRDLVRAGKIGRPLAARISHTIRLPMEHGIWRINNKKAGAGVFFDLTSHDIDLMRFILDDEIGEIYARGTTHGLASDGIADNAMGLMITRKGITVAFHDSYMIDNPSGCEILGTDGSLVAKESGPYASIPAKSITLAHSRKPEDIEIIGVEDQMNPFERSIRSFNDAIKGQGDPIRSGEDGAAALAGILAAMASSVSGQIEKIPQPIF